ncbi:unnamed protein product, partial [Scytosiphon promiscuus]
MAMTKSVRQGHFHSFFSGSGLVVAKAPLCLPESGCPALSRGARRTFWLWVCGVEGRGYSRTLWMPRKPPAETTEHCHLLSSSTIVFPTKNNVCLTKQVTKIITIYNNLCPL